ncbi:MAG: HAD family hydrolase [Desulfuromonas sp.]|nr:HAD family hydrolase [Desulfuromonas sp.]
MKNIKAVVFDCDGVMFDSQLANLAYYNSIITQFGLEPVTDEQPENITLCHTAASPQVFNGLLGPLLGAAAMSYSRQVDYSEFIPQLQIEAGLVDLLTSLAPTFALAVATNRGSSMGKILEHFSLADFFPTVITYLDVERPKPSPDMLLAVAQRLQLKPQQLVFIGDSDLDRQAACEADCSFVSYKWDGGVRIDHHGELLELLVR